ncbi:unnamed protein product, partial [Rotaria sp. Silwood1]
ANKLFIILAQSTVTCLPAAWNNTFRTLAGISGLAASTSTTLYNPYGVAFDTSGTMYVADQNNNRIQKFVGGSATATTVPGLSLNNPSDVHVDNNNILYILDTNNFRVLRWNSGTVTTVAGGHGNGGAYNQISYSYGMFLDSSSNIYVSDCSNHRVTLWTGGNTATSQLVAGGYGAANTPQQLNCPVGLYVDNSGSIYVTDYNNHRVQLWYSGAAIGVTVAGQSGVSGPWSYQLSNPSSVIYDQHNYLYILDSGNSRIQRWIPGATYGVTVAATTMSSPRGLTFDGNGNMIVADNSNHRIISFAMYC